MVDIVPRSFWRFPTIQSFWEDDNDWSQPLTAPSGLSVSEDDQSIYISAALPGVNPKNIEVTVDKGVVWIKGEVKEENKNKKYYRKSTSAFSYRVAVPGEIDQNIEPKATAENGVMTVTFTKSPKSQPKKITIQSK